MSHEEAEDFVEQIVADILDRKGLGDEFENICEEIQDEIRERWITILMEG